MQELLDILAAITQAVVSLTIQYRMAEDIQILANQLIYNGKLSCGSEAVRQQVLKTIIPNDFKSAEWMLKVCSLMTKLVNFEGIYRLPI